MILFRVLFLPISFFYGLIIQLRNFFFNTGVFKVHKFSKPVISIGNIIAGGTGKTPLTIWLADLLVTHGKKVAVISRGYGRGSRGFHIVSDGLNFMGNTTLHGDEPVLTALSVPSALVAVGESRQQAIKEILNNYPVDFILLDDAFQHRSVYRDVDVVLLPPHNKIENKWMLPSGLLREFNFNIKRADIIISSTRFLVNNPKWVQAEYSLSSLINIHFKKVADISTLNKKECIAFAGIAYPENFNTALKNQKIIVKKFIHYKDHYKFTSDDILFLLNICKTNSVKTLLCTTKDLVKIMELTGVEGKFTAENINLYAVSLAVKITHGKELVKNKILS